MKGEFPQSQTHTNGDKHTHTHTHTHTHIYIYIYIYTHTKIIRKIFRKKLLPENFQTYNNTHTPKHKGQDTHTKKK